MEQVADTKPCTFTTVVISIAAVALTGVGFLADSQLLIPAAMMWAAAFLHRWGQT